MSDIKAPVITVDFYKSTQCRFICIYCGDFHYHGRPDGDFGEHRHRVAHCRNPSSPYRETGYYLQTHFEKRAKERGCGCFKDTIAEGDKGGIAP
jgi:hypothetical protein